MKDYNGRADDIVAHLELAQAEITKALSKLNSRKIWLKLSSMYKLASVQGKLQYVKEEMIKQEARRNREAKR